MASVAQPAPTILPSRGRWLGRFLKEELTPFPGRAWIVARMTIAATLMMLWIMTFRIPGAALGAYYTLLFARDDPQATLRSALITIGAVGVSLTFVSVGVLLFVGDPFLHFLWVAGTLFVTFFLISALSEYRAATAFGFLAVNTITSWDFPANTELRFQITLWTALAVLTAASVTVAVEFVFQQIHPSDQLKDGLGDRLKTVEELLGALAEGREADAQDLRKLSKYAMTGTAMLRRILLRSKAGPDLPRMSALVALTGRVVDLAANFRLTLIRPEDKSGCTRAAEELKNLREALNSNKLSELRATEGPNNAEEESTLTELERTIFQIPMVFEGTHSLSEYLPSEIDRSQMTPLFKQDAFSNSAHLQFALKGALAALACYVIYSAVDWRGLSTSVATCMITALSTVGSSRQKQALRVIGALIGGLGFAMLSQVFLLPYMDGITSFTLLFVSVTALCSWVATSSPRLSYAGVQAAFAFYVTHLRSFGPQLSLTIARDDVFGIMLGLLMMWIMFDRIWVKDAFSQMLDTFVMNVRRIAAFDKQIIEGDLRSAINRSRGERAIINSNFDQIRNESDAVLFEFGSGWQQKLLIRNQVRAWQPRLRTYFLLQVALLQYRLLSPERRLDGETEENVRRSETILSLLADLEDRSKRDVVPQTTARLCQMLDEIETAGREMPQPMQTPRGLSRSMLHTTLELAREARRCA